jgi:hypothetical protein
MHSEINAIRRMDEDLRSATNLMSLSGVNPDYDDTVIIMRLTILYYQRLALQKQACLGNLKRIRAEDELSAFKASPHDVPTQKKEDLPSPMRRSRPTYPLAAPRQRKRKRSSENSGVVNIKEEVLGGQQQRTSNADEEDKLMTPSPRKRRRPVVVERSTRVLRARKTLEALDASVLDNGSNTVAEYATPSQD